MKQSSGLDKIVISFSMIDEGGHIDIDQLHESFKKSGMKIPLAVSGHKTRYEIAKGEHPHFLCEQCGRLEDLYVAMNEIVDIAQHACTHSTRSVSVMLHGICEGCSVSHDDTVKK